MTEQPPAAAVRGLTRQDLFAGLGALGAVLTLVTAVMFYFGWRRSDVQAREMSIDVSLFGFSSQDYVLRSISSLYLPLLVLAGLLLGWLWLHQRLVGVLGSSALASGPRRRRATAWARGVAIGAGAVAVACVLFTLAAGATYPPPLVTALAVGLRQRQWVVPLVLVAAALAAAYAGWLHRQLRPRGRVVRPLWQTLLPVALVVATVVLGASWLLEEYASAVGRGYAHQLVAGVDRLPRTVVLSPTPLGIAAPGVKEQRIGSADSPGVRYRTIGLRLLARSGGKVLLVHDGWTPATGTVVVVADSDALTWQFSR